MDSYDVVIVGAGPAGLTAMKYLSDKYNSLLIDKNNKNHIKPCGGLLANETTVFFNKKNINISEKILSNPPKPKQVYFDIDNEEKIENGILINIDRKKFKSWLVDKIDDEKIKFNTKLKKIEEIGDYLLLKLDTYSGKQIIKTKILVDAGGAYSKTNKYFNSYKKYFLGIQSKLKMDQKLKNVYFFYYNEITNYYIWLIPKSDYTILGLGLNGKKFKNKYIKLKSLIKKYFGGFKQINIEAHKITCPDREEIFLGKNNILIIGEAAGLISPSSGEGISYAFKSGYYCAKALNNNINNGLKLYKKSISDLKLNIEKKITKRKLLKNVIKRKRYFKKSLG